ncbi:MAG: NAD(P)/FAD-dependent oxidoreductase [Candidatus Thorarchaeota archaeon]
MKKIGIIGNGVAAVTAIREIRKLDEDVNIDVFSDERHYYYPRPKLIDFISGERTEEKIIQYGRDWYETQNVGLRISEPVSDIVTDSRSILTSKDTYFNYDKLLLAVGCHPFVPPIHGIEKKGVHVLRTLDDAIDIREAVKGSGREIIVGGGILGIELAAAIKKSGGNPIVISNIETLLPAQLDQSASSILIKSLEKMGLSVLRGFMCKQVLGHELATGVESTEGDKVKGDMVVVVTGVRPNSAIAKNAGIKTGQGRGILVDKYMETSESGIFAAGDCMEWNGVSHGIIPVALETAKIAAHNIIEPESKSYDGTVPSNTLQVAGIDLTSIGLFNPQSPEYETIVSADEDAGTYYKAVLKNHIVVGGIAMGNRKVAMKLRKLMRTKENVTDCRKEVFDS